MMVWSRIIYRIWGPDTGGSATYLTLVSFLAYGQEASSRNAVMNIRFLQGAVNILTEWLWDSWSFGSCFAVDTHFV
jgi:hypothetical protein